MAHYTDWLPGKRDDILAMAKTWLAVLETKATGWQISAPEVSALTELTEDADMALQEAKQERSPVTTQKCRTAFDALTGKMRFFKSRYFLVPPCTSTDLVSLDLTPRDTTHTPVPPPTAQAEADISRPGVHLMELHLRAIAGSPPDPHRSDYGYRIYYGVMPAGGAALEAAAGVKRELMKAPVSGNELPFSKFTRRKRELFDFAQEDSGKTAYFCIRYENAKGEPGPWGPMFQSVVP